MNDAVNTVHSAPPLRMNDAVNTVHSTPPLRMNDAVNTVHSTPPLRMNPSQSRPVLQFKWISYKIDDAGHEVCGRLCPCTPGKCHSPYALGKCHSPCIATIPCGLQSSQRHDDPSFSS